MSSRTQCRGHRRGGSEQPRSRQPTGLAKAPPSPCVPCYPGEMPHSFHRWRVHRHSPYCTADRLSLSTPFSETSASPAELPASCSIQDKKGTASPPHQVALPVPPVIFHYPPPSTIPMCREGASQVCIRTSIVVSCGMTINPQSQSRASGHPKALLASILGEGQDKGSTWSVQVGMPMGYDALKDYLSAEAGPLFLMGLLC